MKTRSLVGKSAAAAVLLMSAMNANAEIGNGEYAVGWQSGFATFGIAGRVGINDKISAEGILGLFGALSNYGVRGLYTFQEKEYWGSYAFGSVGIWSWNSDIYGIDDETAFGFGAGVGIEYDWRAFGYQLPPVSWNLELGLGLVNFENYDFNAFSIGAGARYKFGM